VKKNWSHSMGLMAGRNSIKVKNYIATGQNIGVFLAFYQGTVLIFIQFYQVRWVLEMCKFWTPFLGESLLISTTILNNIIDNQLYTYISNHHILLKSIGIT